MFKDLGQRTSSVKKKHPFSDLVSEFGVVYIQRNDVYVPNTTGLNTTINTPTLRLTKPFTKLAPKDEFERDYFQNSLRNPNQVVTSTITNQVDAFFHNVVEEYLTNKPVIPISKNKPEVEEFITHSPLKDKPTTIITPEHVYELGKKATNSTDVFMMQNGETFAGNYANPIDYLSSDYQTVFNQIKSEGKIYAKYTPLYGKKHKGFFYGKNSFNREIEITKQGNSYSIQTFCPSSIVKAKGKTLSFDETTITTKVKVVNDRLQLTSYPTVPEGYEHVFAYSSGSICYNGEKRFGEIGLTTSGPRVPVTQSDASNMLKLVLDEGHKNLLYGDRKAQTYASTPSGFTHREVGANEVKRTPAPISDFEPIPLLPDLPPLDSDIPIANTFQYITPSTTPLFNTLPVIEPEKTTYEPAPTPSQSFIPGLGLDISNLPLESQLLIIKARIKNGF